MKKSKTKRARKKTHKHCAFKQLSPVTHCDAASHPEERQLMAPDPLIPKPTSQVYVAVDPSSVLEYTAAAAFTTTGGGPQSVTNE